ncbi:hypothetical protein CMQ_2113 [Grosmannia clavigera kw1407]|uniref:Uncharacterized protein n=1 Tax=Grosmannia clavigera (strain kw1407 / UAMH 11150) TaxID=655863 RepID=F0XJ40_GROCL|nr:uncharacterized protein CMQ_2113 [Grosmannia clavigera kw1407]EFX02064.1 hypothetical protein CMQ_2113 [Grosmannia clavigera kw1407]
MKLHATAIVCMTVLLALPASTSPVRRSVLFLSGSSSSGREASLDLDTVTYTIAPYSFATTGTSSAEAITGTGAESSLPSVESYESAPASTYSSSLVVTSSADALSASSSTSPSATTVTTWLSEAVTITTTLWVSPSPSSSSSSTTPKYTCTVNEATTLTRTAFVTATATVMVSKTSTGSNTNTSTVPVPSTFVTQPWSLTVPWTNSSASIQTWTALAASGAITGGKQPHGNATHTWATLTASCSEDTATGGALRTKATSLSQSRPFANATTTTTTTTEMTLTKDTASWTSATKHEKPTTTLEMYH